MYVCISAVMVQVQRHCRFPTMQTFYLQYILVVLVCAWLVKLLKKLQVPDSVSIDIVEYLYPCCASCS
jgi:hypothetical protein